MSKKEVQYIEITDGMYSGCKGYIVKAKCGYPGKFICSIFHNGEFTEKVFDQSSFYNITKGREKNNKKWVV